MVACQFWLKIFIILSLKSLICLGYAGTAPTSGPFKSIVLKSIPCVKVGKPYLKDSPLFATAAVYNVSNNTYLRFNLTVLRDVSYVKIRLRSYVLENGKWVQNYFVNDFGSKNALLSMTMKVMGVKYNAEKRAILKGQYYFPNLDVNALLHIWLKTTEYGPTKWKAEVYSKFGTYSCLEFYYNNVPL